MQSEIIPRIMITSAQRRRQISPEIATQPTRANEAMRGCLDRLTNHIPEERLAVRIQHQLLRIAQEAISNAVRHGKPSVVTVTLRWGAPHLTLRIKDNGSGISKARPKKNEGIGLRSMRERAAQIGAKLVIQTAPGRGTRIVVTVPILL